MGKKKLVPKRRFKDFKGEWKISGLEDIVEITMGHSPSSVNYTDNPSDYILVQGNADLKKNRVCPRVWTTQVTKLADKDDLILTVRAPVGEVGKTDYEVVLGRGVAGIKGNEFIFQLLIKLDYDGYWNKLSTGSTFDSINSNDIRTVEVLTPNIQEQQKIGEFFKVLDERIANQERKIAKVKALKSAYLTEMFPQEGETVPKRRFRGCSVQWKTCKLALLYSLVESGNRLPRTMLQEGEVPYVIAKTTDNGILQHIDQHSLDYHGNKMKLFPSGSITFSIDNPEAIFLQTAQFFTSNIMRVLYNEKYNLNQSTFILESIKKLTKNYNWSFKFSGPVVMNSNILVPVDDQGEIDWVEIEKIGKLLSNLDQQITIGKSMLEKLKKMKEAYLEEMFV